MGVNEIRSLNCSLSIMRDIDLCGSALYIEIRLKTSATLIIKKCLNEFYAFRCRSMARNMFNLAPMLEKEKLAW